MIYVAFVFKYQNSRRENKIIYSLVDIVEFDKLLYRIFSFNRLNRKAFYLSKVPRYMHLAQAW